jgi:glycosyltransferase involved in cell wall biosynthesis
MLVHDGVAPRKIITGFNNVDVAQFTGVGSLRNGEQPDSRSHRFLYVGQLVARKAPHLPLVAMSDPRLQGATLTIVGEGPVRPKLESLAIRLGVENRVRFQGLVAAADMPALYARHDTLVMPSMREVWGLTVNEALASGLHAVVSDRAGCAPDVRRFRGVFVASPDPFSIARAMESSMDEWSGPVSDPEIARTTGTRLAEDILRGLRLAQQASRHRMHIASE